MRIEARLIEYGRSLLMGAEESYLPGASVLFRVKEMQENAGVRPEGFTYDMVGPTDGDPHTVACMPDGGLADMVDRRAGSIDRSRRLADMREAIRTLPYWYRKFVEATYCGQHWRDIPRKDGAAIKLLGLSPTAYANMRRGLFVWLEGRLCIVSRRAA